MKLNSRRTTTKTENLAGGEAYQQSSKAEIATVLLTSFVQDQYYRTAKDGMKHLAGLLKKETDKLFIAKAAVYARDKYHMRTVTHLVASMLSNGCISGSTWASNFFYKVAQRPDDITEIIANHIRLNGRTIPHAMRRGFGERLSEFDEYQLSKYQAKRRSVTLLDAVRLCHPNHTPALRKLAKGELKGGDTLDKALSEVARTTESKEERKVLKSQEWDRMVGERKIGYFALLKNLTKLIEQADREAFIVGLDMLTNEKMVLRSKVLPFRFITAMEAIRELTGDRPAQVREALDKAITISCSNVEPLEGRTLIALDTSGSMTYCIGGKSQSTRYKSRAPIEMASVWAAVIYKATPSDWMHFSASDQRAWLQPLKSDSIFSMVDLVNDRAFSSGTDFSNVFEMSNEPYARIITISDDQGWMEARVSAVQALSRYEQRSGCKPYIYSVDVSGYGTKKLPIGRVCNMAGFSPEIFEVMKLVETDKEALVHQIERTVL